MTRLTRFAIACGLTAAVTAVTGMAASACGGRTGSPGELPPMAPRPGQPDPTALPVPRVLPPARATASTDAPPISAVTPASVVPTPVFAPVVGQPLDAGTSDSYSLPLPPLPDGGVPADSRLEPRAEN